MRDPKRIDSYVDKLKEVWVEHPDLRLGQLILNISSMHHIDLYNIEDDRLFEMMEKLYGTTN